METDLNRFYDLLARIEHCPRQGSRLSELSGKPSWPSRGVYFFREPGETRTSHPGVQRIVRVGTHAVSATSGSTLWGRLRTHRGTRSGGGNHRSSIFRLHVGAALLARGNMQHPTWGMGMSASKETRAHEIDVEDLVSTQIGAMSVLWIEVPDEPSAASARAYIERNSIALLSRMLTPVDPPSDSWLGAASPREAIRRSGLWNVRHVSEHYDPHFLDEMESFVGHMRVRGV